MPFVSKKQESYLKREKPEVYKKFVKDTNKDKVKAKPPSKTLEDQRKTVLKLLRDTKFPKNHSRKNFMAKGQKSYEGMVLGTIMNRGNYHATHGKFAESGKTKSGKYNDLLNESRRYMKMADPKFSFSSIQFNKNQQGAKHKDSRNVGLSYITGLGTYKGGGLKIWDYKDANPQEVSLKNRFVKFNGSKRFHETAPFTGERYTLVYYSVHPT